MSDLISRDLLREEIERTGIRISGMSIGVDVVKRVLMDYREYVLKCIDEQPTTKMEENHGRWIEQHKETYKNKCSVCGGGTDLKYKFCPHCRAIMDKEGE